MVYCGETIDLESRNTIAKIYTSDGEYFYSLDRGELLFYIGMNPISRYDSYRIQASSEWFNRYLESQKKHLLLTSLLPEDLYRIIAYTLVDEIKHLRLVNGCVYNNAKFKIREWEHNWYRKTE
jgi:hypothetical protein